VKYVSVIEVNKCLVVESLKVGGVDIIKSENRVNQKNQQQGLSMLQRKRKGEENDKW
jgi:hypothetical protein